MALTLLQVVNKALQEARIITADLSALTSQSQQAAVNVMVQSVQQVIHQLAIDGAFPQEIAEGSITLVTDQREYTLASDFVSFAEGDGQILLDETNGWKVYPYPGGYFRMRTHQTIPGNYPGLPHYYAINQTNGKLRFDRIPTSQENGNVYKYLYNKRISFSTSSPSATFPVGDDVLDDLVPAFAEWFNRRWKGMKEWDSAIFRTSMSTAASKLSQSPQRRMYGPHG